MTAIRSSHALSVPPTQNSAPVHEYKCMYTHHVRQKTKKWKDGRLKFHTFNKRVMIYDDTQNFIGDTHWKEGGDLPTGEEIILEIGVLVDVGELMATTQTDLAPLFERERKKPEKRKEMPALSTNARMALVGKTTNAPRVMQQHRSLNALLGTPKGSHGRAQPMKSPFEARHGNAENEWEEGSDSKRRKTGAQPWTVTRVTKTAEKTPLWARTSDVRSQNTMRAMSTAERTKAVGTGQAAFAIREVMDLTSETENEDFQFSDVTIPSDSPIKGANLPLVNPAPRPVNVRAALTATAARPLEALPQARVPFPSPAKPLLKAKSTSNGAAQPLRSTRRPQSPMAAPIRPVSPPISTKNHVRHVDAEAIVISEDEGPPAKTPPAYKTRQLRIAKSQQRPMLLCQKAVSASKPDDTEKQTKRRTQDNFAALSDTERDAVPWKKTTPSQRKTVGRVTASRKATQNDLAEDKPSSSTAFQTASSSPGKRIVSKAKESSKAPSRLAAQDDFQGMMDYEMLGPPQPLKAKESAASAKAKSPALATSSKPSKSRPFRRVQSENITVTVDSEDSAIPLRKEAGKQAALKANKGSTKAPKQPLRRVLSENDGLGQSNASKSKKGPGVEMPKPPEKRDQGPWTIEASDLFTWRPPDWEERLRKKAEMEKA